MHTPCGSKRSAPSSKLIVRMSLFAREVRGAPATHGPPSREPAQPPHFGLYTIFFHYTYCMVYSIQTEVRERGLPCALVVQYYCKQCGHYRWGGGQYGSFIKALK